MYDIPAGHIDRSKVSSAPLKNMIITRPHFLSEGAIIVQQRYFVFDNGLDHFQQPNFGIP